MTEPILPPPTPEEIEEARKLVAFDWLVSRKWNVLHFAELTDKQLAEMYDWRQLDGPIRLACNRTAAWVSIPGVFTRMGAMRCSRCCRVKGYPEGKGSPKNDTVCRTILRGEGVLP